MSTRLLTALEAADVLRCTVRHLRNLKIPVVRLDRRRLYDPRDVEKHIQGAKCLSSNDPAARTGKRSSNPKGLGFLEALAQHPAERPSNSNVRSETRLPPKPSAGRSRRVSRSIKLAGDTGRSTGDA